MNRRVIAFAGIAVACLLLLVAGTAGWLLGTESGLRFAADRVTAHLPEGLEIGAVEGTAAGPLVVRDVRFATDAFTVELTRLELEWRLAEVVRGVFVVDRLRAAGLTLTGRDTPPAAREEPFTLPERLELPIDIIVRDARVHDISLQSAAQAEPLIVEAVRLEGRWTRRGLEISELQVDAPLAALRATAEVVPRGAYPLEAEARFTLRLPGYAPLEGHTRLGGSLRNLELTQRLAEPYNLRATATIADVLQQPTFDAAIEVEQAALARIAQAWPPIVASTQIEARGSRAGVRLDLTARASGSQIGTADVRFAGELAPDVLTIEQLVVDVANAAAHLEASGRVELSGPQPVVDVDGQWTGLAWPLRGPPQVSSERGALEVAGTLDAYRARLDAALSVPNQADGHVTLTGSGDAEGFAFSAIDIATLEGTLRGTGNVTWAPALAGSVDLQGSGLNPGGLLGGWPGRIDLVVRGDGRMTDSGPVATLEALRATGQLRGQPVELEARGAYRNEAVELETLHLRSGDTQFQADGRIGQPLDVEWSVASEDLSTLLPVAEGRVRGSGRAVGPLEAPQVVARLSGSGLRYAEYDLASVELEADVDLGGETPSNLDVELREASIGGIDIESVSLHGSGTKLEHALSLEAATSAGQLDLGVDGSLGLEPAWAFVIERLRYEPPGLSPWSLRAPASGQLAAETARLDNLCLTSGEALLCIEGRRTPDRLAAAFELEDLPLALANPFLPPAVRIEGSIGGTGSMQLPQGVRAAAQAMTAGISLRTQPIRLLVEDATGELQPALAFAPGEIRLEMNGAEPARFTLDLPLETAGGLAADATIAAGGDPLTERPLEGHFRARLPEIGFLTEFTPRIAAIGGRIEGDLDLSGTLAAPELDGSVELLEGTARLPGPEIRLHDIFAEVRGQGAGELGIELRASSGGGTLRVDGSAIPSAAGLRGELTIEGEDFRVFNTPVARVRVTPDLDVTLADNRLEVTGVVHVPAADIELTEAPASAVGVSDDQVIVQPGAEKTTADDPLQVAARVQVILGDEVSFSGYGLTATLAGDLRVVQEPGEPTTATGEISVREGAYAAYGQALEIERGRVLFAGGPIDQPGIDVRAVRRPAEDILVGVEARGSLRQPEFSVFSEPPMSESEQLAYLVLGRPLEGGQASENSALARAALALGIKGGNYLTEQFGDRLGVDEFGIETQPGQTNEQAALVIGKYLSPDLYVSYGIGLLEPVSTLRVRYALSSKWRVVTESSSLQSGGDIFYSIER